MAQSLKWGTDYLLKTMSLDQKGTENYIQRNPKLPKLNHYFLVYQARPALAAIACTGCTAALWAQHMPNQDPAVREQRSGCLSPLKTRAGTVKCASCPALGHSTLPRACVGYTGEGSRCAGLVRLLVALLLSCAAAVIDQITASPTDQPALRTDG